MSVAALAWAKVQKTGSPVRKAILMVIADYADERGQCWPSRETIANQAECSKRATQEHLKALEASGLVRCEKRFRKDGSQTSDMITLELGRGGGAGFAPPRAESAPLGESPAPPGAKDSPLTTFEPSLNPPPHSAAPDGAPERTKQASNSKSKKTTIPHGFPTNTDLDIAAVATGAHWISSELDRQGRLFRNHAIQEGRRCADWPAALENWLLRAPVVKVTGVTNPPVYPRPPNVPDSLWLRIEGERGSEFAAKWLASVEVDAEAKTIRTRTRIAAEELRGLAVLQSWTIEKGDVSEQAR